MQVFLLALGTRGDVELFTTLALALKNRGHDAVLGVASFQSESVEQAGLTPAVVTHCDQAELTAIFRQMVPMADKIERTRHYVRSWLLPRLKEARQRVATLAGSADYFVSNLQLQLEKNGKPVPGATVIYDPPLDVANVPLPKFDCRDGYVLPLAALNRRLVDPVGEWDPQIRFTGFWRRAEEFSKQPTQSLRDFVEKGAAPVVLTMGSMAMFNPQRLVRTFADALGQLHLRGVIIGGWSQMASVSSPGENIFTTDEAPYDWLFARSAACIHHGGCGTLSSVLSAGIPSIVLPQIAAQEKFAAMLARENLTAGILETASLDSQTFADAIRLAMIDSAIKTAAQNWSEIIMRESGAAAAAELMERHWQSCRAKP